MLKRVLFPLHAPPMLGLPAHFRKGKRAAKLDHQSTNLLPHLHVGRGFRRSPSGRQPCWFKTGGELVHHPVTGQAPLINELVEHPTEQWPAFVIWGCARKRL